jgi:predicted small metal-binding protein
MAVVASIGSIRIATSPFEVSSAFFCRCVRVRQQAGAGLEQAHQRRDAGRELVRRRVVAAEVHPDDVVGLPRGARQRLERRVGVRRQRVHDAALGDVRDLLDEDRALVRTAARKLCPAHRNRLRSSGYGGGHHGDEAEHNRTSRPAPGCRVDDDGWTDVVDDHARNGLHRIAVVLEFDVPRFWPARAGQHDLIAIEPEDEDLGLHRSFDSKVIDGPGVAARRHILRLPSMMGGCVAELVVRCECGFEVRGREDEVVEATQEHGRKAHNMDVTREQVLEMAKPAQ